MTTTPDTLIIVPTYNEKENIAAFITAVFDTAPDVHILVVDDNSPDGTGAIVARLAETETRLHLLSRPDKDGLGRAYIAGFVWALVRDYAIIFEMDADFSHNPAYIPALRAAIAAGADVAIGSRNVRGGGVINWPVWRTFISQGGSLYSNIVLQLGVKDCTAGYVCYRRRVLEQVDIAGVRSNGYVFQIEMKYRAKLRGMRLVEVPIIFPDRERGVSKMVGGIVTEAITGVLLLRYRQLTGHLLPPVTPTAPTEIGLDKTPAIHNN